MVPQPVGGRRKKEGHLPGEAGGRGMLRWVGGRGTRRGEAGLPTRRRPAGLWVGRSGFLRQPCRPAVRSGEPGLKRRGRTLQANAAVGPSLPVADQVASLQKQAPCQNRRNSTFPLQVLRKW